MRYIWAYISPRSRCSRNSNPRMWTLNSREPILPKFIDADSSWKANTIFLLIMPVLDTGILFWRPKKDTRVKPAYDDWEMN